MTTYTDPAGFSFSTNPTKYAHIALTVDNDEAVIVLKVNPERGLRDDTLLKLNSYDLSVDIELADALNRLRFEHPQVKVVTITSGHPQIFSSGANIYMLKKSSHAFKVNFCKYTNETRLYLEEASQFSGKKFLCALNGTSAGGGYELALACDRIILIDDKNANVSLPEVPLLGVLPGTGGLTRLTDKRKIRPDLADVFCTTSEGVKGTKARDWALVDEVYAKTQWQDGVKHEVSRLKEGIPSNDAKGISLDEINPNQHENGFSYTYVDVRLSDDRVAKITISGPANKEPTNVAAMLERGNDLWLLRATRELDDAILRLRFFYRDHGLLEFHATGDASLILDAERPLYDALKPGAHWFLRETLLHIGRVLKRIEVSSRSLLSVVVPHSAFAGMLAELLFMSDRVYALTTPTEANIWLSPMNQGFLPTWNNASRLEQRFGGAVKPVYKKCDLTAISLSESYELGLLTFLLDEIDFHDELRIFKEERASLSPDALSAMEANLRAIGKETLATKIFGRLSAWQNWVFTRENATGSMGALTSYGEEKRARFAWERC